MLLTENTWTFIIFVNPQKKKFATENSDVALFLYSSCKKTEKIRGSLVIVAFFPLKEEQKL